MINEFSKIIIHILGKHHLQTMPVDNNAIINHIYSNPLSENSISALADFIYGISEISDNEYLIIDTLLYSAVNNQEGFQKIYNMIFAYNPCQS